MSCVHALPPPGNGPFLLLVTAGIDLQDIFGNLDECLVVGYRADSSELLGVGHCPAQGDVRLAVGTVGAYSVGELPSVDSASLPKNLTCIGPPSAKCKKFLIHRDADRHYRQQGKSTG